MIKNKNFIYFIIILLSYLDKYVIITKAIIFPFQYSSFENFTSVEPNLIITYYDKNIFYFTLEIGTPTLNLTLILDNSESGFILKDGSCLINSDYSISKSSTFKCDEGLDYQYINYELKTVLNNTQDKIYLNQIEEKNIRLYLTKKLEKIEINNFKFLYIPTKEELKLIHKNMNKINNSINFSPKCGYLGILPKDPNTESTYEKYNFFYQLKNKKIIDNYYWFIHYKENKEGEFIIGVTPHEAFPEKFSEDDLYMTYATFYVDKYIWQIHFSSIEILNTGSNNKNFLGNNNGIISISNNYIHCPKNYFDNITSIYFQKYLDKNICKKDHIRQYNTRYTVIYCYRNNFTENDLKTFPVLEMNSNELNFIFEFNSNDLFLKTDSVYIFKIIYNMDINFWKFGNTLLEKYQFVFNYDTKMFGLYHHIYDDKNKKNEDDMVNKGEKLIKEKNGNNYIKILIIIVVIILIVFFGIFILRKAIFFKKINSKIIEDYNELTEK